MLPRSLFDTAVFVYAVGVEHPYRAPCRRLVQALAGHEVDAEASAELVQEFLHQRARRTGDRVAAAQSARRVSALCILHDVTVADLATAMDLYEAHPELDARDAVHAATALNRGIGVVVSPDRAFDAVPALRRMDPAEAVARLS